MNDGNRLRLVLGLALVIVALIGAGVTSADGIAGWMGGAMGGRGAGHMAGHMGWASGSSEGDAPAPREGAPEIEVISSEFGFDPAELRIEAGRPVNVSLVNEGDLLHDLTLEELDVRIVAGPGDTGRASITADAGTYRYFCSVPGHAEAGMEGILTAG